jgi:transposase
MMDIGLHDPADALWLAERIDAEADARQRDRYRVVELALAGKRTLQIAGIVKRPRKCVQDWVYRYRDQGRRGLTPRKRPGRPPTLPPNQIEAFKGRLDAGVTAADGVCTLRGSDIRAILEKEFGCVYSLNGVYDLLGRLGCSSLRPRPSHRKKDEAKQRKFKSQDAPLF